MTYQEYMKMHEGEQGFETKEARTAKWDEHCKKVQDEKLQVGEGATVHYWTDRNAYTIIKRTKSSITMRRDKAILNPNFKPDFVAGGFFGTVLNQDEQEYTYEEDENGRVITARWSKAKHGYYWDGLRVTAGRHEFYDYNF